MEASQKTLLRLLAKALAQESVSLRTHLRVRRTRRSSTPSSFCITFLSSVA
jgi:hypothetical protein